MTVKGCNPIATTVSIQINAPLSHTFALAVPIDIPSIMQRRGLLPAVEKVTNQTGPWDAAGHSRHVHMSDGSSVFEELTHYALDEYFAYRVTQFKKPLAALVSEANGKWVFTAISSKTAHIQWTYAFTPTTQVTAPLVSAFVHGLWKGYIDAALGRVKTLIETPLK